MIASAAGRVGARFRRVSGFVVLLVALGLIGGVYTAFAPRSAAEDVTDPIAVREGEKLFLKGCISCHGQNLQGVRDRGPSLIGVGAASVDFQVRTGRMPAARQEAQVSRKRPKYNQEETDQLAAYVQSVGGGPRVPEGNLRGDDPVLGGELYRINCASCHGFGMNGGALSSGKYAPSLVESADRDIYEAMLTGPQNMPVFGDNQLTPDEKRAVVAYVQTQKEDVDPGGAGIGRTGPVPEGLVVFVVGIAALLVFTVWIAGKS
jgi:ubiquinol-cytochrome c reductase cytochrome c subunit